MKDQYSDVLTIGRDDIKNEYEALWMILKDVKQGKISSVVLPNIMRNILEYYFSFSCKMEKLSEELDKLVNSEKDINYKTFYRYINRGSHSDSINISYLGQISANKYLEMFEGIFKKTKDELHFNKMLGIEIEEVA
ncbi:AAA family ATPase [Yersinia enterocolitica]|uniref:AAA family ATPase n=1 Tax=Yersinia enterocolitica TaxID=630 RepID=UPI0009AEB174|nr:AAA family ATPase [Yersinia enterocolitica]